MVRLGYDNDFVFQTNDIWLYSFEVFLLFRLNGLYPTQEPFFHFYIFHTSAEI